MLCSSIVFILTACCLVVPPSCQGTSSFLLFTGNGYLGYIYKATSKSFGLLSSPKVIIQSSFTPEAVTYDPIEKRVYWSDTDTFTISRAFLNGSSEETVVRNVGRVVAVSVDASGRNLYWADNSRGRIEVAKLEGKYRKILVRTTRPTDMVLDLRRRQIYWSSYVYFTTKIERSSMDGSNRQVILTGLTNHDRPSGLCLDSVTRTLYWTEKNSPEIFYVNLDNSGNHHHFQTRSSNPFRLAILDQRIYWTDRGRYYSNGKVASVNITTKGDLRVLTNNVYKPKGIYAYDGAAPIPDTNCSKNNGGCSHLCLLKPQQDVCACSNGMTLKDDGKTCYYKEFLLVVDKRRKIFYKSLDDLKHPKTPVPLGYTGRINTVDFDPLEHKIYWTDNGGVISRAFLNGSSMETIVDRRNFDPRGHAIDVIGRNIYWYDSSFIEIGVCKLNGSYPKILLTLSEKPKAMVLDSING